MSSLKLDTTGDLALENNSFVLLTDTQEETAQRLQTKFRFFLGEWHLDRRIGLPYYQKILVKNPNLEEIEEIFREVILADEAVTELISLSVDLEEITRVMSVSFEATLTDGTQLDFAEFVLQESI